MIVVIILVIMISAKTKPALNDSEKKLNGRWDGIFGVII